MASKLREKAFTLGAPKSQRVIVKSGDEMLEFDVRALGIAARGDLMTRCMVSTEDGEGQTVDLGRISPDLVIACTFDPETGEPVFTQADRDQVGALSSDLLDPIITAASLLSGLTQGTRSAAEKNSEVTTISDSSSR
jgi:hypothetical protein